MLRSTTLHFAFLLSLHAASTQTTCHVDQAAYNRTLVENSCPGFGTEWILFPDGEERPHVVHLRSTDVRIFDPPDVPSNVRFLLYTRGDPDGAEIAPSGDSLANSTFDPRRPTKVVTHGFRSSGSAETCTSIRDGYLAKYDANVVVVDWAELADDAYWNAATYPQYVGNYTAELLDLMVERGADPGDIHLVGHSLGAHLSGFAGKAMAKRGRKVGRVTGLDPAYPGFELLSMFTGGRLEEGDADFVDVIHTCGGALGLLDPVGHADFYPNGGTPMQPGCSILNIIETCSHGRSWRYFAESINTDVPFVGYSCSSWTDYLQYSSGCEGTSAFMGEAASPGITGKYYLKTSDSYPFALGHEYRFEGGNELK